MEPMEEKLEAEKTEATRALVDFVTQAEFGRFPAEVISQGKRCLLDGFGLILAGSTAPCSFGVRRMIGEIAGKEEATILGREAIRSPAMFAALANGTAGHALDYDDTQLSRSPDRIYGLLMHPTIPPLAASLAVGERVGATGAQFLEAFLVGFEVECKIAEAIFPDHYKKGFHTSGTIGTFGAAASAAKLMALKPDAVPMALGIAASSAGGIRANFGTMTKPLHVGRAAESGVRAAVLAGWGFTADPEALDGPWGFFRVLGGGFDPEKIVGRLGNPHTIVNPGVSVKPYPCGVLGHPSMDAMLKLVRDHHLKPEQIKRVRLRAGSNILNPLRYPKARNELEAKFCLPFMLAGIALRGKAGVREFSDDFVGSEPVQRMMEKVETILDLDIEAKGFDKIRSIVEVDLMDGRTLSQKVDERYRGGPDFPFTKEDLEEKFTECAELVLPPEKIREAISRIANIESLPAIRDIIPVLQP
jgi:2-methylcitrate dehydratase PrpD